MQQLVVYETTSRSDFDQMVRNEAGLGDVVLLDSQLPEHPSSGNSYLFAGFDAVFRWDQHQESSTANGDPWKALARFRERFPGYCCGFLGYDLKNAREQLSSGNPDPVGLPDMWMGRPTRMYILKNPGHIHPVSSAQDSPDLDAGLSSHGDSATQASAQVNNPSEAFSLQNLRPRTLPEAYHDKVRRAKTYITEGDVYEVNLSHQLEGDFDGEPYALFQDMLRRGPVPFAAYLRIGGVHACCASPERFLTRQGEILRSDPIKGTRPRGRTVQEDEAIIEELTSSQKDKAENLMIVDLVRNDFSRVCQSGTVKVSSLFEIQHFSTVHQMVSRVEGRLRDGESVEEILSSCFPMGSMTGAPKIRSMEIIEELEDYKRGLYSGAIGVITPQGDFNFNVVIRTAIIRENRLYYATGGAITADSDPVEEWEETLVKARALGGKILLGS